MSRTGRPWGSRERDPLAPHVRRRYFVEVYFAGRRVDGPYATSVALESDEDLDQLAQEAANSNEFDEVKVPYRYLIRIYEYRLGRDEKPRRGPRIIDYVPRGEEGGVHGHAA
jgi:hypothetical protein